MRTKKASNVTMLAVMLIMLFCITIFTADRVVANAEESRSAFTVDTIREKCEELTRSDDLEGVANMKSREVINTSHRELLKIK